MKQIKKIGILAFIIMMIGVLAGCNSVTDSGGKVISLTNASEGGLTIKQGAVSQLSYAGQGYVVKTFHAQFTLDNQSDGAVEFSMRIPHYIDGIAEEEALFLFLDDNGSEAKFSLAANESKEFIINTQDYNVLSNLGPRQVGGINGMIHELVINEGVSWNYINIEKPTMLAPWNIDTDISFMQKCSEYEKRIEELSQSIVILENEAESLQSTITILQEAGTEFESDLPEYQIWKYSEMSGIRKHTGEAPLRIYPSLDAPVLDSYGRIVNCIFAVTTNRTSSDPKVWGMVLANQSMGIRVGFAPIEDLIAIDEAELERFNSVESLGGIKRGDRIEKLIGSLNRDYQVIHENGPIYMFPDDNYQPTEPSVELFSGNRSIDAFTNDFFQVTLLRTDSPQFPLECGYKVGDNAQEVIDYFAANYVVSEENYYAEYNFSLSENETISFRIDTDELTEGSLIKSIWIH